MNTKRILTICFFVMIGYAATVATFRTPDNTEVEAQTVTSGEEESDTEYKSMICPAGDTSFKTYMDYRTITNTRSAQYKLQNKCYTDKHGMRKHDCDYCIAVGSYYADKIGDRLQITLSDGTQFTAVVSDFKADSDTDKANRYTKMQNGSKNVIEFVVNTDELPALTKEMGDISYNGFKGNIEKIERIEE